MSYNIQYMGQCFPSRDILIYADSIKHDNYKTSTIKQFRRRFPLMDGMELFLQQIALRIVDMPEIRKLTGTLLQLEPVFFSVSQGCEEHTDELDPEVYTNTTVVIPLVVPEGKCELTVDGDSLNLVRNGIYLFQHDRPHSLQLDDKTSGCTVLMIAIKK
jgi:hypothetical protein